MQSLPVLGLVIPCYNEEESLPHTEAELSKLFDRLVSEGLVNADKSFVAFVNDGSRDATWSVIEQLKEKNPRVRGIKLSNNFGHQAALLAGLMHFKDEADCIVSMDADLQDDVNVVREMLQRFNEGFEIVYGVRSSRKVDSNFKKNTALFFYKLMEWLGVKVIHNHADYRLASKRVLNELATYPEVNLFLRGLFPLLGFKHTLVYYDRFDRVAGSTKYPFFKMLSFALDGITSFSIKPLRLIFTTGLVVFLVSIALSLYTLYSYFFLNVVRGWASMMISMYFIGGVQLISIGVLGEYMGKIYRETKARPRFIIEKVI